MIYPRLYNKEELNLFQKTELTDEVSAFDDIDVENGGKNIILVTSKTDKNGKDVVIVYGSGEVGTYINNEDVYMGEIDLFDLYFVEGITRVKAKTFQGQHIEHCLLSESMEELGEYSFSGCEDLESVVIPNGLKYIRKGAFRWCNKLGEINLPSTIESVGEDAFCGCKNITITIDKPKGSVAGAPWGADNAHIVWKEI
jgi:hypothetical protein